jgi:hypothetical protein
MDSEDVAAIRSKQAARMVLAKEAEMVKSLVDEGLLTPKNAEEFLENISRDTRKIEKGRNKMYRLVLQPHLLCFLEQFYLVNKPRNVLTFVKL